MLAQYEKIIADADGCSFFCRAYECAAFTAPWHFHPEYELTLIVGSSGQRFVGDDIAPFAAGDLVLLGPNLPHCWLNAPPPRRERAHSVVVQFTADMLGEGWLDRPELAAVRVLLRERSRRGVRFAGAGAAAVAERLRALPTRTGLARLLTLLSVLDALAQLPAHETTALASERFSPALDLAQAGRLERVCRFAHQHFREPLRQTEAAAQAHLSPAAFSRFFRRRTGRTFVDYLNDIRVGEACRLLVEREALSVVEICYGCGFGNLSNFNRHFRRRQGQGPREYRRRYLRAAADRAVEGSNA